MGHVPSLAVIHCQPDTGNRRATSQCALLIGQTSSNIPCELQLLSTLSPSTPRTLRRNGARCTLFPRAALSSRPPGPCNEHSRAADWCFPSRARVLARRLQHLSPGEKQSSFTKVSWLQHTSHTINSHNSPGSHPMRGRDWCISRAIFHKQLSTTSRRREPRRAACEDVALRLLDIAAIVPSSTPTSPELTARSLGYPTAIEQPCCSLNSDPSSRGQLPLPKPCWAAPSPDVMPPRPSHHQQAPAPPPPSAKKMPRRRKSPPTSGTPVG